MSATLWDTLPLPSAEPPRRLVVLVHGWWARLRMFSTDDVVETIRAELPDAELMLPKYPSHPAANTEPLAVAEELADAIELADSRRRMEGVEYEEIILIGYSLGTLIARKTFVIGKSGWVEEHEEGLRRSYGWADKVSRIILLAGVNRGWSLDPKPKRFSRLLYLMYRLFYPFAFILPAGRLIRSFRRGQPFVENLRIQWHRLEHEHPIPPTIQLYGKEEDVVTREDMVDIQFCSNFIFLDVPRTGHFNAADFHDPEIGPYRRAKFVQALTAPIASLRLEREFVLEADLDNEQYSGDPEQDVQDVVFVIHGIRDFGHWTRGVRTRIMQIAAETNKQVLVATPSYKRFPLLGFLLPRSRRIKVSWFVDQYARAVARYPNARIHFIGHSNGTYLLASALEHFHACRFNHVVFAGSVVRRRYPWTQIVQEGRVKKIRNDMAADDWVVAIFPRFFEQIWEVTGLDLGDIGSGGVYGFEQDAAKRDEILLRGRHAAAINPANHDSLARYVLGMDDMIQVGEGVRTADTVSSSTKLCSALCGFICLLLVAIPFALFAALVYAQFLFSGTTATFGVWLAGLSFPYLPVVVPLLLIALLVWWLLSTI